MPYISSPIAYLATSSPTVEDLPRKKRKVDEPEERSPLKPVQANIQRGPFVEDDSEEEDDLPEPRRKVPQNPTEFQKDIEGSVSGLDEAIPSRGPVVEKAGTEKAVPLEFRMPAAIEPDVDIQNLSPASGPTGGLLRAQTCSGKSVYISERRRATAVSYECLIAARSTVSEGCARKSYYGIDIHQLIDETAAAEKERDVNAAATETIKASIEQHQPGKSEKKGRSLMWTEKYRARKFTDLIGDERTHRSVLRWLKNWDPIVFGSSKPKPKLSKFSSLSSDENKAHRKILLLTGPPGLGKTTLAHVCARQAGYEVQEINASDERSNNVVKGRIRDMVGTENVRGAEAKTEAGIVRKAGRPVCVVIDEVDGVVTGSGGGGEGGFVKALVDLVLLDQKNSQRSASENPANTSRKKRKGERFRLLRPLILVCNDVYHPSLRPLRQSTLAEIIHVRKPPLNMVVSRMHSIFEREGVPADMDGVRRLCESTWGVSSRKEGGNGVGTTEGDIRSIIVLGEWTATKLRATTPIGSTSCQRLTKRWVEGNVLNDLAPGGGAARSLGRGGARDVVDRVFQEGAGFPKSANSGLTTLPKEAAEVDSVVGVAEAAKRRAVERLREMVDTSGDTERIVTDCFTSYPNQPIQDDNYLTKPNCAYEWLHFHDQLHSQLTSSQDWELAPYLSSPILAFHHLFASSSTARRQYANNYDKKEDADEAKEITPFSGPGAPYTASEALKANSASLTSLQSALSLPLSRMYRSTASIATELLPYTLRVLNPDIKPVLINSHSASSSAGTKSAPTASVRKASEKALVLRAVEAMAATGVRFERTRVEYDHGSVNRGVSGWVYRMEPALDMLGLFETMGKSGGTEAVRFAVRQVLDAEWTKEEVRRGAEMRKRRMGGEVEEEVERKDGKGDEGVKTRAAKRDFFGRVVKDVSVSGEQVDEAARKKSKVEKTPGGDEGRVWVSFHEGFSNAVRKPITLDELMRGL